MSGFPVPVFVAMLLVVLQQQFDVEIFCFTVGRTIFFFYFFFQFLLVTGLVGLIAAGLANHAEWLTIESCPRINKYKRV